MKRLLFVPLLLLGGCLWGCQTMGPKNIAEAMALVGEMREIAKEQGVAWTAVVEFDGHPRAVVSTDWGVNLGLKVVFRIQGNAQGMIPPA